MTLRQTPVPGRDADVRREFTADFDALANSALVREQSRGLYTLSHSATTADIA
ncbi:MAG: hypothetical protein ABI854_05645 [Betaproteobacteria bacterium]